jgi:hypothetical protein
VYLEYANTGALAMPAPMVAVATQVRTRRVFQGGGGRAIAAMTADVPDNHGAIVTLDEGDPWILDERYTGRI